MSQEITFAELRQFLGNLGFRMTRLPTGIVFEHEPSNTVIVLRRYRSRETVSPTDLAVARTMLDQRGLMEERAFEQALFAAQT
jgi:hypothetical protein